MAPLTESYWAATDEIALLDTTCGGILRDAARRSPQHIALIDADGPPGARRRWTYAELLRDAEHAAHALRARFEPGTHVAVWGATAPSG